MSKIDIVFDGPPEAVSGRFVEVEDAHGHGLDRGEWVEREDGLWALRMDDPERLLDENERLLAENERLFAEARKGTDGE
jgi:hypothetical protein